jgi:hypothetical protein
MARGGDEEGRNRRKREMLMKRNKTSRVAMKRSGIALNPVAKFSHKVNKSFYFTEKTKYCKKKKHKKREEVDGQE